MNTTINKTSYLVNSYWVNPVNDKECFTGDMCEQANQDDAIQAATDRAQEIAKELEGKVAESGTLEWSIRVNTPYNLTIAKVRVEEVVR